MIPNGNLNVGEKLLPWELFSSLRTKPNTANNLRTLSAPPE